MAANPTLEKVREMLLAEEPHYDALAKLGPGLLPSLDELVGGDDTMLAAKAAYLAGLVDDDRAPAIVATLAGEVQIGFITLTSARPHLQAGRARALAVTSRERMRALPDLPTVAELGVPGYELNQYYGAVITAKAPPPIVRKLSEGIAAAVKAPDVAQRFEADGWTVVGSTPEQFRAVIRADLEKWTKVTKDIGLVLN